MCDYESINHLPVGCAGFPNVPSPPLNACGANNPPPNYMNIHRFVYHQINNIHKNIVYNHSFIIHLFYKVQG